MIAIRGAAAVAWCDYGSYIITVGEAAYDNTAAQWRFGRIRGICSQMINLKCKWRRFGVLHTK